MATEIGTYVLPVMVSMRGIDAQVNQKLRNQFRDVGKQAGGDFGKAFTPELGTHGSKAALKFTDEFKTTAERAGAGVGLVIGKTIGGSIDVAQYVAPKLASGLATVGRTAGLALGGALTGALGLAIGGIGLTLAKGFERLESIDSAKFKLKALGHDAGEVKTIMDNALKSVKGTSFGLDAAATSAAAAVAAGIKPGEQLTKYLKEIADTAAVAGTSFEDMGHIFNKVQTQNKAYTDDLQMLSDRGVPIFQWLQDEYGVTADALTDMVQGGEVDAAHFQSAIDKHIGGAALTMGQSFAGSVDNAKAALARLGAAVLTPVFASAPGGIASITTELDKLTAWVEGHPEEIRNFFKGIGDAAVYMGQSVLAIIGGTAKGLAEFVNAFGDTYAGLTRAVAAVNRVLGRTEIADQLDADADAAFGWADSLYKLSDDSLAAADKLGTLHGSLQRWADQAQTATGIASHLGDTINGIPSNKDIKVNVDTTAAAAKMQSFVDTWSKAIVMPQVRVPGQAVPGSNPLAAIAPKATGGPIFGPGTGTSDSVPIMASHGEHMWTADEVNKVGGQANMYRLRSLARKGALRGFAGGGAMDYFKLADIAAPVDPARNADRSRPSMGGGDRGKRGEIWYKGPFNYGGNDPGRSLWPGGVGGSAGRPGGWMGGNIHWPDWMFPGLNKKDKRYRLLGYKDGGEVNADWFSSVAGTPYGLGGFGSTFDCSGAVSGGVNVLMGRQWNQGPPGGSARMATGSEAAWLTSQGFVLGVGPPGSVRVGWVNGGPGGGHTAMTLPDGRNFESGSGRGVTLGGAARGADDPEFTQHAYLPPGPQLNTSAGSPGSRGSGSSGSSGSSSRGGGGSTQSLSDVASGAVKIGIDGLMESIGADGSFLPENLGIPKTLMAALGLKFNTSAGSFSLAEGWQPKRSDAQSGAATAGTSDSPFGMQTTMPELGSPASGTGAGPLPGPTGPTTNININNPQGDPAEIEKRTRTALMQTPRVNTHMPAGF